MRRHAVHLAIMPNSRTPKKTLRPVGIDVEAGRILEDGLGRAGQVGRAAKQLRHHLRDRVHHDLAGVARGHGLVGRERREVLFSQPSASFIEVVRSYCAPSSG